jgi:hypothetical protein
MRIFGGKDYYDYMIQYGFDPLIILNRNNDRMYPESVIQELGKDYINHFNHWCPYQIFHIETQNIIRVGNGLHVNGIVYYFNRFTVVIGNNIYGGTLIHYNNKVIYHYSEKSLEQFLNTLGFSLVNNTINKKYNENVGRENISLENRLIKYMIEKKISIITFTDFNGYTFNKRFTITVNGDNLREFQLYKILNAYDAHAKLSHWVGNVLLSSNQMRDIPNDAVKIAKHGFDKYSFRKQKNRV